MSVLAWLLVLGLLSVLFNRYLESQHNPNQAPAALQSEENQRLVELKINRAGHYVVSGKINHLAVTFLLDTGATDVAIPEKLADKLGLQNLGHSMSSTANGLVQSYRTMLDSVTIGNITLYKVRASVLPELPEGDVLLGMSFLKRLEMVQKENTLTLIQRTN